MQVGAARTRTPIILQERRDIFFVRRYPVWLWNIITWRSIPNTLETVPPPARSAVRNTNSLGNSVKMCNLPTDSILIN